MLPTPAIGIKFLTCTLVIAFASEKVRYELSEHSDVSIFLVLLIGLKYYEEKQYKKKKAKCAAIRRGGR